MIEKKGIVSVIREDVEGLMGLIKQKEPEGMASAEERQKEIQDRLSGLKNHQRGDLVSLELLSYTINRDPEIREMAMRGLLEVDGSFYRESVIGRVIKKALLMAEDEERKPAEVAMNFLRGHVNDGVYSLPINWDLNIENRQFE